MPIHLIAAMASNRVIGKDNRIPWQIPGEQKRFREITIGHSVVMGRRTFESIGSPLPQRTNIILTRNRAYRSPGCRIVHDHRDIIRHPGETDIFIIGGEKIFELFLPDADGIYLSILEKAFPGDTYFPDFSLDDFSILSEQHVEAAIPYRFIHYQKKRKKGLPEEPPLFPGKCK